MADPLMQAELAAAIVAAAEAIYNVECGAKGGGPLYRNLSATGRLMPTLKADHAVRASLPALERHFRAKFAAELRANTDGPVSPDYQEGWDDAADHLVRPEVRDG